MATITVATWDDNDRWGYRFSVTDGDQFVTEAGSLTKTLTPTEDDARQVAFDRAASVSVAAPPVTVQWWADTDGEWVPIPEPIPEPEPVPVVEVPIEEPVDG